MRLLAVEDLVVRRRLSLGRMIEPVANVTLSVDPGASLGLVGESGCGKSTLANALAGLVPVTSGRVEFEEQDVTHLRGEVRRRWRRGVQIIFQDPVASLNPRRSAAEIVAEPYRVWQNHPREQWRLLVGNLLASVGLDIEQIGDRRPHELSGGQCQRVSIARALALDPKLLICDEVVSALDVSAQAQVLNFLKQLSTDRELALIFISHDLAAVDYICERVCVMYLGKICEVGRREQIFARPAHPYSAALVAASRKDAKGVENALIRGGQVPSFRHVPSGCRFRTRCPRAERVCALEEPSPEEISPGHVVMCHFPLDPPRAGAVAPESRDVPRSESREQER